jgi:hypothetical protein
MPLKISWVSAENVDVAKTLTEIEVSQSISLTDHAVLALGKYGVAHVSASKKDSFHCYLGVASVMVAGLTACERRGKYRFFKASIALFENHTVHRNLP